jgi:asparagine synthase (glutamine-hydrolysing)
MCGIAGAVASRGSAHDDRVAATLRAMAHRGPDDVGCVRTCVDDTSVVLGHTRLAILDLSTAGHQPMVTADGRFTLVYNGEVYNYRELRQELAREGQEFRSSSDTEVLLAAWSRWGVTALSRLTGMFAFAVFDRREGTLTLARDPFGIKPLYYWSSEREFAFASEMPALKAVAGRTFRPDLQRAYDYLVFGEYDDSDRTFFADVRSLPAGHFLTFDLGGMRAGAPERWWHPPVEKRSEDTFEQAAERIRHMFLDSVRLQLRSDVPVGAALSGGIDSASIVCAMRRADSQMPIRTFTFVARGSRVDEEGWADLVNEATGATATKVVLSHEDLQADLDDLIATQGEPFGSTSIFAQYRVYRAARDAGVIVTLDGQGADELFAGYHGYPGPRVLDYIDDRRYLDAIRFVRSWSQVPGRSMRDAVLAVGNQVTPRRLRGIALHIAGRPPHPRWLDCRGLAEQGVVLAQADAANHAEQPGRRLASALRSALLRRGLPALLRHGDRNSMRWSVESRVPFLSASIAEYVLTLPPYYLVSDSGQTKHVFRAAMRGIVPDAVLDRQDKIGFATPERDWLYRIAESIRTTLQDDLDLPFIEPVHLLREFDAMLGGRRPFSWQMWRWINYARWSRLALKDQRI